MFLKILQLQKHAQSRALQLRKPVVLHLARFAPTQQRCMLPCTVLNSVCRVQRCKNGPKIPQIYIFQPTPVHMVSYFIYYLACKYLEYHLCPKHVCRQ